MIIEERIRQLLVPGTLDNLYPLIAPDQTETPYTTYLIFNAQNLTTHSAPLPLTRMWHMQFNTYSPKYLEARVIGDSIQVALIGYTDAFIQGITPVRVMPSWDDVAKLHCSLVELQITETLV